jgi:hypothetical protein
MELQEQLKRDLTWLETWIQQHPKTRAAQHLAPVLDAYKELAEAHQPAEEGVPLAETAQKYIRLSSEIVSLVPAGSVFEASITDREVLAANFVQHLYRSHTLGCVECFGGRH